MHVSNKTSPSLGLDTEKGDLRALWVRRETVPLLWATVGGPSKAKRVWNATRVFTWVAVPFFRGSSQCRN